MLVNTLKHDYHELQVITSEFKNKKMRTFTFSMTKLDWRWNAGVRLYKVFAKFKKLSRLAIGVQVFSLMYSLTMSILGATAGLPFQPDLGLSSSVLSIVSHVFNLHVENYMSENIMRLCKIMKNFEAIKAINADDYKEFTWKKMESVVPYPTELFVKDIKQEKNLSTKTADS